MRRINIKVSVAMAVLALQLAGCAGGESSSDSLPSAEAVSGQNQEPGTEASGEGEQVVLSEIEFDLEVKPEDTPGLVNQVKEMVASHNGSVMSLITGMYETEGAPEEDGGEGVSAESGERAPENEKGNGEKESEETDPGFESELNGYDGYGEEDYKDYDGYYEDYDGYYDDYYYGKYGKNCQHWTSVKIMVPDSQVDEVLRQLSENGRVLDRQDYMEDYTVWYQGLAGRIAYLEDEEQRLISLLEDARSSGKARTADEDSDFLEKVMNLENHLWSVREELNVCRYGDMDDYRYGNYYDYDTYSGKNLAEFEHRKGKTIIKIEIYVREGRK